MVTEEVKVLFPYEHKKVLLQEESYGKKKTT